jgi:nicotinamide mononucleotide transporter
MYQAFQQFITGYGLDTLAFATGALGVWLTIRQNIWCWPMALMSVLICITAYYRQRLYGDMALQVFYFFAGIYGWIYWKKNLRAEFVVRHTSLKALPALVIVTAAQAGLYYYLLRHFNGDKPLFDAVLTAGSLTATYMMTKKWIENWAIWVIIDGAYVILYGIKSMWPYALLYLLFTIMAFYGWLKWRRAAS